jgi:hypothetical protein
VQRIIDEAKLKLSKGSLVDDNSDEAKDEGDDDGN